MSRQHPEILKIKTTDDLEQLGARHGNHEVNAYQILGVEPSLLKNPKVFDVAVTALRAKVDATELDSTVRSRVHDVIKVLANILKDPEQREQYDIEHVRTRSPSPTHTEPAIISAPSTPLASPKQDKRKQHELASILGAQHEAHSITFTEFLRGEKLPTPSSQFEKEDLSNIKLLESRKDIAGANADQLLITIQDKIGEHIRPDQKERVFASAVNKACKSLGINSRDVTTDKQKLWVLLKYAGKGGDALQTVVSAVKEECVAKSRAEPGLRS